MVEYEITFLDEGRSDTAYILADSDIEAEIMFESSVGNYKIIQTIEL